MQINTGAILLVDDSPDDVFFAERLLRKAQENASVMKFDSPVDAIDYLARLAHGPVRPAVCFVDIRMPQLTGFDVAEWIRGHSEFDDVPVVMLSGSDEPSDVGRARIAGADCYLKKFPSAPEMQAVLDCVRVYKKSKDSRCRDFSLPCNLLSTLPAQ